MILDNGGRFKNQAAPGHASSIPAKFRLHPCRRGFLGRLFPTRLYRLDDLFPTPLYHLHPCRRASLQASFRWNDDN